MGEMTETENIQKKEKYAKLGPDLHLNFFGYTAINILRTPEFEIYTGGLRPSSIRTLSRQEYIHNCGLSKKAALERWEEATKKCFTFEIFYPESVLENVQEGEPIGDEAKGLKVYFHGHHTDYGPADGSPGGEQIRKWNDMDFVVVGIRYPKEYNPVAMGKQLLGFLRVAEIYGIDKPVLSGQSFGAFLLLDIFSKVEKGELQGIFSRISRLRLISPPYGSEGIEKIKSLILSKIPGLRYFYTHFMQRGVFIIGKMLEGGSKKQEIAEHVVRYRRLKEPREMRLGIGEKLKIAEPASRTRAVESQHIPSTHRKRLDALFSVGDVFKETELVEKLRQIDIKSPVTLTTSTKDPLVPADVVIEIGRMFKDTGFAVTLLFIEDASDAEAQQGAKELLDKSGLQGDVLLVQEKFDPHDPLQNPEVLQQIEEAERG